MKVVTSVSDGDSLDFHQEIPETLNTNWLVSIYLKCLLETYKWANSPNSNVSDSHTSILDRNFNSIEFAEIVLQHFTKIFIKNLNHRLEIYKKFKFYVDQNLCENDFADFLQVYGEDIEFVLDSENLSVAEREDTLVKMACGSEFFPEINDQNVDLVNLELRNFALRLGLGFLKFFGLNPRVL